MDALARWFESGGPVMWPIAIVGAIAVVAAPIALIVALVTASKRAALYISIALCGVAAILLSLGALGYLMSMRQVADALQYLSPEDQEVIRNEGISEAMTPAVFALWLSVVPLGGGVALFGLGYVRLIEWRRGSRTA